MKIADNSSNKLKNAIKIIENSAYGENLTYMMVGLIQLLQFIKLPEVTLYEIFHYLNLYSDKDFFSDLYSHQQKIFLLERREKELGKSFKTDAQILNFNCDTFFIDIKNERFNTIIEQYPEKNYLQQMINFCKHIKIMSYSNEEIYLDMLYFSIMKLLLINSDSISDFPDYNVDYLSELIAEILIIYRPLKLYLDNAMKSPEMYVEVKEKISGYEFIPTQLFLDAAGGVKSASLEISMDYSIIKGYCGCVQFYKNNICIHEVALYAIGLYIIDPDYYEDEIDRLEQKKLEVKHNGIMELLSNSLKSVNTYFGSVRLVPVIEEG
jgi:hypothetical protein